MPEKIMIIAGETSGDTHSASLIHALRKTRPGIEISGMGGEKMRRAGAKLCVNITELSIIGFTDVLKNLGKIKAVFRRVLKAIDEERPDAVVLVDYPGFNLKLSAEIKKRNIPVIYYISPQVWAWWKARIRNIKGSVDKMIVIFKFEEEMYKEHGVNVSFVGHPLLENARPEISREDFLDNAGLSPDKQTIGLMPGSRKMEVERIFPVLLESAKIIHQRIPQTQFMLLKAPDVAQNIFIEKLKKYALPVSLCKSSSSDFLQACDFVLVASGTATLETAIMQKPMAVVYKVSFLNWLIARALITLPYIGLVNVAAGKKIVPEFVQFRAKPRLIADEVVATLSNREKLKQISSDLTAVRETLGTPGAAARAAEIILTQIRKQ